MPNKINKKRRIFEMKKFFQKLFKKKEEVAEVKEEVAEVKAKEKK